MSIRAYRIEKMIRKKCPSFNMWHDEKLIDFLEKEGNLYGSLNEDGCGITEFKVELLERAIKELDLEEEIVKELKDDIEWSKTEGNEWIQYSIF